jgi:hypothetical protein
VGSPGTKSCRQCYWIGLKCSLTPCLLVDIVLGTLLEDHTTRLLLGTDSVPVILR